MSTDDEIGTTTGGSRGATITTVYVTRQVKAFAVYEAEIESLSSLNAQATAFLSLGAAFLSYAVGIWTNASFATQLTPAGELANSAVAPGFVLVAGVFFWLAWNAWLKRQRTLADIRGQSRSETK
jgi:hypothetical protein